RRDSWLDGPARCQVRGVRAHGAEPHGDGVKVCAETLAFRTGLLVADPAALTGRIVHFAVAGEGELERHPRSIRVCRGKKEWGVELQRRGFLDAEVDVNTVVREVPGAATG